MDHPRVSVCPSHFLCTSEGYVPHHAETLTVLSKKLVSPCQRLLRLSSAPCCAPPPRVPQ